MPTWMSTWSIFTVKQIWTDIIKEVDFSKLMVYQLDFSDLPTLDYMSLFHRLSDDVEKGISKFPEVTGRAEGAVYFSNRISAPPQARDDNRDQLREAFLRASIAEFAGIEEALERDLKTLQISSLPLKIKDTADPLLHIIRELRNLEIHLQSSDFVSSQKDVLFGDFENPERAHPLKITNWYIADIGVAQFRKLRNASRYTSLDIQSLITWFNQAQKQWGIGELVRLATERYCSQIIDDYSW